MLNLLETSCCKELNAHGMQQDLAARHVYRLSGVQHCVSAATAVSCPKLACRWVRHLAYSRIVGALHQSLLLVEHGMLLHLHCRLAFACFSKGC
jgi:hypothetical protein